MAVQTKEREQSKEIAPIERLSAPRLPITQAMMQRLEVSDATWRVLTDSIFPTARTVDGIALALGWSRSKGFDILLRPCHVVPMWSNTLKKYVETVWPAIFYFRATAHRTAEYAGIDKAVWGPEIEEEFVQHVEDERDPRNNREVKRTVKYPEWCELTVHRFVKGEKCAFTTTVYWKETYATAGRNTELPNDIWMKRPRGQLAKCAEAAVLRMAFTEQLGNEYVAEEMEGKTIDGEVVGRGPAPIHHASRQAPDKPGENVTDAVEKISEVDAEPEPADVEEGYEHPTDFLEELAGRLGEAQDEDGIDRVWKQMKVKETLGDNPLAMKDALKAKLLRSRQIKEPA
jgi:phage recombination protein Bet